MTAGIIILAALTLLVALDSPPGSD